METILNNCHYVVSINIVSDSFTILLISSVQIYSILYPFYILLLIESVGFFWSPIRCENYHTYIPHSLRFYPYIRLILFQYTFILLISSSFQFTTMTFSMYWFFVTSFPLCLWWLLLWGIVVPSYGYNFLTLSPFNPYVFFVVVDSGDINYLFLVWYYPHYSMGSDKNSLCAYFSLYFFKPCFRRCRPRPTYYVTVLVFLCPYVCTKLSLLWLCI